MTEYKLQKGSKKTKVNFSLGVKSDDILSASITIKYKDGTKKELPLTLENGSYGGYIIDTDGDLTQQSGKVETQAKIITKSGYIGFGSIDSFEVEEIL